MRSIWEATIATLLSKFVFALTFIAPIIFFELSKAVLISVIWGLSVLSVFTFIITKQQKKNPWIAVIEHLVFGLVVVLITFLVGNWTAAVFS